MSTEPLQRPEYTHLILECYRCASGLLDDTAIVRQTLRAAAHSCQLRVVKEGMHRFQPQGVTGYALLMESHISVHTWPEHSFALVDVLSCMEIDTEALVDCVREMFKAGHISVRVDDRRIINPDGPAISPLPPA